MDASDQSPQPIPPLPPTPTEPPASPVASVPAGPLYKIIGGDGREYGPVELHELEAWVADGRVGAGTTVWRSDQSVWLPASQWSELADALEQSPLATKPVEPETTMEMIPVGFWARLGAYILDLLLSGMLFSLLTLPWHAKIMAMQSDLMAASQSGDLQRMLDSVSAFLILMTAQSALSVVYYVGLNGKFGATPGKMVIGARIVQLDGGPLGFRRAFLRYGFEIVGFLTLGLGYLMIAFREDKRGLHDLVAKTQVIYRR